MTTPSHAHFIPGSDINAMLDATGRVYLAGHLERSQPGFAHVADLEEPTEVGVSRYGELTVDQPHLHERNVDFMYVVRGTMAVRIIPTAQVEVLEEGGLSIIEPGLAHVCIAHPQTQVLFFKLPGGNDKVPVELDEASRAWVQAYVGGLRGQGD